MFEWLCDHIKVLRCDGSTVFSGKELAAGPRSAIDALIQLKLLKKASPAKVIECPGCEQGCLMPVEMSHGRHGRAARFFVSCDKRDDTGRVLIESEELEQWQINIARLASLLASGLGTGRSPEEISPHQAYYLGVLTVNRKKRSAVFVVTKEVLESALASDIFGQYIQPFFIIAAGLPAPKETKVGQAIPLMRISHSAGGLIAIDMEELKNLLSAKSTLRQDLVPVRVPAGTEWNQVFISFVNEQSVQIKVDGKIEHRSFDELGFSDTRKAEHPPTQLWVMFLQLAKMNGVMKFQDAAGSFSEPEKIKKWVSQLREKLCAVFPSISGDPFYPYRANQGYKIRLQLTPPPDTETTW